jgi:hypothetical protein
MPKNFHIFIAFTELQGLVIEIFCNGILTTRHIFKWPEGPRSRPEYGSHYGILVFVFEANPLLVPELSAQSSLRTSETKR